MENKNNVWLFSIVFLIVGFLGGWLLLGSNNTQLGPLNTHMMPGGEMMHGGAMTMSQMMADMNANLAGKIGDEFDKAFLSEMIMHHEGAVVMAELALTSAKHKEIKDLANAIITAQKNEINQMKDWQKSWYNIQN